MGFDPASLLPAIRRPGMAALALLLWLAACAPVRDLRDESAGGVGVAALSTEHRSDPLGLDTPAPRLSWQLRATRRGVMQSAYQIRVARSAEALAEGSELLWDSGKQVSDESVLRPYGGPALESGQRYWWQVRAWDEHGEATAWSAPAWWEMGLLKAADWSAQWIEPEAGQETGGPAPLLRKEFRLHGGLRSARAYITSHGLYELYLNGRRVGADLFTPGWSSYDRRLAYQSYDVTDLLNEGANAAGVMLGDGWYRGRIARGKEHYGDRLGLLLELRLRYADGSEERIVSDSSWKSATGAVRSSGIYEGESYDARLEQPGWSSPGYDDQAWSGVKTVPAGGETVLAEAGTPVRRHEEFRPVRIFTTPAGETVADMGQNLVGWVRLRVQGPAGTVVRLRHAEVLDAAGNFYTQNLRSAQAQVSYTLKGQGVEIYEPHFSYQGFRYVAVDGYPGALTPDRLTGVALYADMAQTGALETSDPQLNQLQHNILWGEKGNFLAVPSDCPQRDERLGWTGDAQVFSPSAALNMDVSRFLANWMADVAADQYADGAVPWVVPDVLRKLPEALRKIGRTAGAAGWSDAAVIVPWNLYRAYGDRGVLEAQYPSMVRWVEYEKQHAGESLIWSDGFQFGDWLDYGAEKRGSKGITPTELIATAYFAHSADLLARSARVLGRDEDAARYGQLFEDVRRAFQQRFIDADGQVGGGTQTAYVLALDFALLAPQQRAAAAQRLAQAVREAGHLSTGFLGTPHLLQVLSASGQADLAYALLLRREFPSWLYPVTRGATTIWERWDGIKPDGSFEDAGMNSFNHYAYGAVDEWMFQNLAGIAPDPVVPGYKHFLLQPLPGGGLSHAAGRLDTPYGTVESSWSDEGGVRSVKLRIPPNSSASLRLPGAVLGAVREGGRVLAEAPGVSATRQEDGAVAAELGSGEYAFSYPLAVERRP